MLRKVQQSLQLLQQLPHWVEQGSRLVSALATHQTPASPPPLSPGFSPSTTPSLPDVTATQSSASSSQQSLSHLSSSASSSLKKATPLRPVSVIPPPPSKLGSSSTSSPSSSKSTVTSSTSSTSASVSSSSSTTSSSSSATSSTSTPSLSRASTPETRCVGISFDREAVKVKWADGHESQFLHVWLRDHCPQSVHPTSHQRSIDTTSIPPSISPLTVTVRGSTLRLDWPATATLPASSSEFDLAWLRRHCYSPSERAKRAALTPQTLWDKASVSVPTVTFSEFSSKKGLREAVAGLITHGIVMVRDMPLTPREIMAAVAPIGVVKRTFYAEDWWDTKPRSDEIVDTAYTNVELKPHIDGCYFRDTLGLQFFCCTEQAVDGGISCFVDGFRAAEALKAKNPAAFQFFSTREIAFQHWMPDGKYMVASGPVFEHNSSGELVRVRFNKDDRAPLTNLSAADVKLFYDYFPALVSTFFNPSLMLQIKLRVGDMIVVNNHRVMHGRTSFVGMRNLVGCYMDADELNSCARNLGLLH